MELRKNPYFQNLKYELLKNIVQCGTVIFMLGSDIADTVPSHCPTQGRPLQKIGGACGRLTRRPMHFKKIKINKNYKEIIPKT